MTCAWLLTSACGDGPESEPDTAADAGPLDASRPELDARSPPLDATPGAPDAASDGSLAVGRDASVAVSLRVLSYNVAGLPEGISQSMPSVNSPLISALLNDYDLALLQEDFNYHAQIISLARHPFKSTPGTGNSLGDGLNWLSTQPFSDVARTAWAMCFGVFDSGSDCLTPKGFSYARFSVGGLVVDVYDVHTDAGSAAGDQMARADNLRQLATAINTRSAGHAVIVAGDFNARYTRPADNVPDLVDGAGLRDVWVELVRQGSRPTGNVAVSCSDVDANDPACERIDKLLYRSGGGVELRPREYRVEGAKFVDANGSQLSDHRPVSAVFDFVAVP
jgi:endonuclease/exonuclease/phosphatase family metal-dependent hydrolase